MTQFGVDSLRGTVSKGLSPFSSYALAVSTRARRKKATGFGEGFKIVCIL